MKPLDRLLQNWRASKARPWIRPGDRVLDIGCFHGEFLESLRDRIGPSVGLDPLTTPRVAARYRLLADTFQPPSSFPDGAFDAIVLLATLEHIEEKEALAGEFFRILAPGGRVVMTVPSPFVDHIIHLLVRLRLAEGMSLEQHHGFDPATTPQIFGRHQLRLLAWRRFQLGLNHLFVFEKPASDPLSAAPTATASADRS